MFYPPILLGAKLFNIQLESSQRSWKELLSCTCVIMFHLFTSPETATYIQKLEKEKRDKAAGQTQDNRSFLAKYVSFFFCTMFLTMHKTSLFHYELSSDIQRILLCIVFYI